MAAVQHRPSHPYPHEHAERRTHHVVGSPESSRRRPSRQQQALRRGDACLMCRAKKLKCSATKPACDQCTKREDECIYDAVRPASRVEKLERKLAEIEAADLQAALAVRRHSTNGLLPRHTPREFGSLPDDFQTYQYTDPNTVPFSVFHSAEASASTSPDDGGTATPALVDLSTLEGQQWWSAPSAPYGSPQAPWDFTSLDPSTWATPVPQPKLEPDTLDVNAAVNVLGLTPPQRVVLAPVQPVLELTSAAVDPLAALGLSNFDPVHATNLMGFPAWVEPPPTGQSIDWLNLPRQTRLEEQDIPQIARDYLLNLFFSTPRQQFGSEVFTEAQFRAKLALPPAQRQHPCLLFAMYAMAAHTSFIPCVRGLSEQLVRMARERVDQSVREGDRVLDAINATKTMVKSLVVDVRQGTESGLDVYTLLAKGVALAKACKLDQIKSSIFTGKERAEDWPILGPPKSQWDLVERIHAFWGVWANERAATLMLSWRPLFRDEAITTPIPWRAEDYLEHTINHDNDLRLCDAYMLPERGQMLHYAAGSAVFALHLCARAKHIRSELPEVSRTYAEQARQKRASRLPVQAMYPAAYNELVTMVDYMSSTLPQAVPSGASMGSEAIASQLLSITESLLLSVRLHLHDSGLAADRECALAAAHDIARMVPTWGERVCRLPMTEAHSTVRNRYGLAGPYATMAWFWATDVLVRATRELRAEAAHVAAAGQPGDAAARLADADRCVASIQQIAETLRALGIGWDDGGSARVAAADVAALGV